jgi:PAS domain S-box-containing protein
MAAEGWPALFASAFRNSRNPMVLVDGERRIVDANAAFVQLIGRARDALRGRTLYTFLADGPLVTPDEWQLALAEGRFTGETSLLHADGRPIGVQFAGATEIATGRRLVLFVALSTSRWGVRFRRPGGNARGTLTPRETEVVQQVALGETSAEIAAELGISEDTAKTHVRNAMNKLGARSRAHLVAKALTSGLVEM